jgi:hypothetical protein
MAGINVNIVRFMASRHASVNYFSIHVSLFAISHSTVQIGATEVYIVCVSRIDPICETCIGPTCATLTGLTCTTLMGPTCVTPGDPTCVQPYNLSTCGICAWHLGTPHLALMTVRPKRFDLETMRPRSVLSQRDSRPARGLCKSVHCKKADGKLHQLLRWRRSKLQGKWNLLPAAKSDFTDPCDGHVGHFLRCLSCFASSSMQEKSYCSSSILEKSYLTITRAGKVCPCWKINHLRRTILWKEPFLDT